MAFSINEDLVMEIRKGTTGQFIVEDLPQIFLGWTARCVIKKDPYIEDSKAFINIVTTVINDENYGPTINIIIPPSESDKLPVPKGEEYASYVWGLMMTDGDEQTFNLIPEGFEEMPECRVYPEITGVN